MTAEKFVFDLTPLEYTFRVGATGIAGATSEGTIFARGDITGIEFLNTKAFVPKRMQDQFLGQLVYYYPTLYSVEPNHFTPSPISRGNNLIPAGAWDKDWLIKWTQQHNFEAKHQEISEDQAYQQIETLLDRGHIYILLNRVGQVVSLHALTGQVEDVGMISRGYTPPRYRGHGYAVECLSLICEKLFAEGFNRLTWFTENENLWKRLNPQIWEECVDIRPLARRSTRSPAF